MPALNRLGHQPIGVFEVVAGAMTPSMFVLVPCARSTRWRRWKRAWSRTPNSCKPARRISTRRRRSRLRAARGLRARGVREDAANQVPAQTAAKRPRLFELRTYESHSEKAHRSKVQMFEELGEMEIFRRVGLKAVFFAQTLAGPRMPSLVYMLVHDNLAIATRTGRVQRRPGVEEAVGARRLQQRRHRVQHHQRLPSARGLFADLIGTTAPRLSSRNPQREVSCQPSAIRRSF